MAQANIFTSIKKNNAPYNVSPTNLSFQLSGGSFSYEFQTRNWSERLADGSVRIVTAEYVRQMIDSVISKTLSVQ